MSDEIRTGPGASTPSTETPADDRHVGMDLLFVDPRRINLATQGLNAVQRPDEIRELLRSGASVVLDGDWDRGAWGTKVSYVEDLDIYTALRDCLLYGVQWQDTPFFQRVLRSIEAGNSKWNCTDRQQLLKRLTVDIKGLYDAIARDGYKSQTELNSSAPQDEIRVGISREGRLIMFDGRHRLSIARLLEVPEIPVRVVARHQQWVEFKASIRAYAKENLRGRVYQEIDHPDLRDIPAKHGTERIGIVHEALEGYRCAGKGLLDIGTHWGYMAQQMEKLGFICTGVELNPDAAEFARRLRTATESRFEIWEGDLLDYPGGQFDVVLAMSIFHHMIKTRARHEKLKSLLERLSPDIMVFEPHDPQLSAPQMEGAFRNYAPEEFATFVAEHSGLPNITYLGTPKDRYRRPIYRLSR